ncbi:MAG TPA: HAD family hydrolase [Thermomicrobiaceae bacterium]|nr:HAD family hydrolase [Thermomicrobiaceae bacterium]
MTRPLDLLVSDFAGTTMEDAGAVLSAYRSTLTRFEIPFSEDDLAARRGASKRAVFEELAGRALPPAQAPAVAIEALAAFEAALRDEYASGEVREVPGAEAALRRLQQAGVRLALTTGFNRELLNLLVGRLGWQELFDVTLAAEDAPLGRPAPFLIYQAMMALEVGDIARVAVAGDTPLDLQAGNNARAGWVIGVLSGAHGVATLGATPHTHLLPSIAALPGVVGL